MRSVERLVVKRGCIHRAFFSLRLSMLLTFKIACSAGRSTTSFSISSLASCSSAERCVIRISRALLWASDSSSFISSSIFRAVCSLYSLGPCVGTIKNADCRGPSREARPSVSLIPNWVIIVRAISVARCKSFCAPVDTSAKIIYSAALPPKRTVMRASNSERVKR